MSTALAEVLAGIGGVTTLSGIGAIIYLVYRLLKVFDQRDLLRDNVESKDFQIKTLEERLGSETSALAAARIQLENERDLRAAAEKQRNEAWMQGVTHAVNEISTSGIADAARLGSNIMQAALSAVHQATAANSRSESTGLSPTGNSAGTK